MTALVVAAVVVLVAVVALAASDRVVADLVERKAAGYLVAPLGDSATIRVHGRPFLTQALRGRYRDVEVSAAGLRVGELDGATLAAHLHQVHLPLRALAGRRVRELPCEQVHGELLLGYAELARVSRVPGLSLTYRDGRLVATASLPVPGISQLARVGGEALLSVTETGGIWLRVRGIAVAGITVPAIVLNQLVPSLTVPIPLPPLPYGLRIDLLTPTADGLLVSGSAQAVVFRARPVPGG